ncbi:MAG: glutamate--cysteine ligase [Gammaproteobacteria bacterium]|nr:glutamate--cysteine ligase [Gammaproteobacteria bacterium]
MGQEIQQYHFTTADFDSFRTRMQDETRQLAQWFRDGAFSTRDRVIGLELEAWLIDREARPAPINTEYLRRLDDPMAVPELARFNIELNVHPQPLSGHALSTLHADLQRTWEHCYRVADDFDARLLMTGILPTLEDSHLVMANMSEMKRYRALNEQVLLQRQGRPLRLDIRGHETLRTQHRDVMLESASTSFQLHLKVNLDRAAHYYNLAQMLSAPLVAVAANSPYLFGRDLWDETRIPVFEQSVEVGGHAGAAHGPVHRVSFGTGYVHDSLFETFQENCDHFPVLLPIEYEAPPEQLAHLRLHNGTIWRWNRPLIGFDDDGTPHLRIEHRVIPAGPTLADGIANAAFFYGLIFELGERDEVLEWRLPFATARDNFYAAARHGLESQVTWFDGKRVRMQALLVDKLLPLARRGLERLELDGGDIERYTGIIRQRLRNGCNGAAWQRAWVARHGRDWQGLTEACLERQRTDVPVHEWDI